MGTGENEFSSVPNLKNRVPNKILSHYMFDFLTKTDYNNVRINQRNGDVVAEIRKRITFYGRVQGVGFRYTAKCLAKSLGLTGWVRNEYDGTVLMEVQGREQMINKLLKGINHNMFITIDWIDGEEIPVIQESCFYVR